MTVSQCPKCHDDVVVPATASEKARVQCPLCREEFELSELFDQLPPALVVLDDPEPLASPTAPEAKDGFQLADTASGAGPAVAFKPDGVSTDGPSPAGKTSARRRPSSRPQRKQSSPMKEMIKVFLGGIVGLVIAQLILWWWPGDLSNRKRDFLKIAPSVGKVIPFIVPDYLMGKTDTSGNGETPDWPQFPSISQMLAPRPAKQLFDSSIWNSFLP